MALMTALLAGCTTSAWMVAEEPVPDPDSGTVISETEKFHVLASPGPRNPVLSLELVRERVKLYDMHLASERYIQQYRPRYGYMVLGLTAMGLGLYLSNSSVIDADRLSTRERALFNLTSVSVGAASFMAMKPVDEPREAGEQRLLQKMGTKVFQDTISYQLPADAEAGFTILRGQDTLASSRAIPFRDNMLSVHLGHETGLRRLSFTDTTGITVTLEYRNVQFRQNYPIRDIMQQYVEVTSSNVPLRTSPAVLGNNIIHHVDSESRFPYLDDIDDRWYRVLKSEGPAYVLKEESERIWLMADTVRVGDMVVLPEEAVFGDLEIERDLPANRRANPEAVAIVIANGDYSSPVRHLPHAERTAMLAERYLTEVLGYYADNVRIFENMTERRMERLFQDSDSLMIGGRHLSRDESDLFIYYYGHAFTDQEGHAHLLPVDYDPGEVNERLIPLREMLETLGGIRSRQTVLVLDTDWTRSSVFGLTREQGLQADGAGNLAPFAELFDQSAIDAIFWAAGPGQHSEPYSGVNGRGEMPYDIFTWYFFQALKQGADTTGDILEHLERHVSFTSRRLHDRAQEPGFSGNSDIELVRQP